MRVFLFLFHCVSKIFSSFFLFFINFYQKKISPELPPSCRYTPTCSHYAKEAIEKYGLWGAVMAILRILRCHPFAKGGYDPVKPPFFIKKDKDAQR